ncbi:MAG TPA: methyltransferase domain-containing protein [Burkholderiaceae bacterium]|nr:methyltransferase domain-containing protein [Burkholderiaceae bacterium]
MTTGWQVVSASAIFSGPQYYNDCLGPLWFDAFAAELVQRLPERPAGNVLEIACGTGLVTRRLRERLEPPVRLVATDLSQAMLDYARAKLQAWRGIEWREADALKLPFEDSEFGAVVCGFGIMFTPDRQAALREARRVLAEAGILLFSVWDRIEDNPHALANTTVLEALFPGDPEMKFTTPYDMADPGLLHQLLAGAGFRATRIETKRIRVKGADPRSIATGLIRGTPRATLIERRGVQLEAVIDKVTDALAITGGDPYSGQAQAVIVQALAI